MIVFSILLLGIVATAYNKRVKPKKRLARQSLENQLQMFRDLESLRHFMAVYLDRGTCVFYHPFTDERIQPDLISGFIAAITSVYGEIKGDGVRGTLEEIQYQGLRLNSYSGEFIIGILILEGEMTPLLRDRLQFFVELFENQYDNELTQWNGLIDCFDSEWVVSTLNSAYNYEWLLAHKFGPTQKVTKIDARILDYISAVRDDKGEFFFTDLLSPLSEMLDMTEAQILDRLLSLQDKGIISPVSIQTILQRQGMGLANGEISADNIVLDPPVEEVVEEKVEEIPSESETEPEPVDEKPEKTKEDLDPMDEFVKDVESLLTKEKKKDENDES
jgi:DNA-binding Lrp family transcriptional regulator